MSSTGPPRPNFVDLLDFTSYMFTFLGLICSIFCWIIYYPLFSFNKRDWHRVYSFCQSIHANAKQIYIRFVYFLRTFSWVQSSFVWNSDVTFYNSLRCLHRIVCCSVCRLALQYCQSSYPSHYPHPDHLPNLQWRMTKYF